MDYWILVLFVSVAVWRATYFLFAERGPRDIMTRFRALLAKRQKRIGGLFDLFSCFYCLSVWVALVAALFISHSVLGVLFHTLLLSGIAILIQVTHQKLKD